VFGSALTCAGLPLLYPSREFLLQLPRNTSAFAALAARGSHPAFKGLSQRLPVANQALAQRLAAVLSQLAHWCPELGASAVLLTLANAGHALRPAMVLFARASLNVTTPWTAAEASYLPDLCFPWVGAFASLPQPPREDGSGRCGGAPPDERLFETLATLLAGGWTRGWWAAFPHPPVGLLARLQVRGSPTALLRRACAVRKAHMVCVWGATSGASLQASAPKPSCQDLLAFHDAPLAAHLASLQGGFAGLVWPHLASLCADLLPRRDWLQVGAAGPPVGCAHAPKVRPGGLLFFISTPRPARHS
jgi:hypothetical protein